MRCNILAVGLPDTFLQQLTDAVLSKNGHIIPATDLAVAKWLLTQRRFDGLLIDADHFSPFHLTVWQGATQRTVPIMILGTGETKYDRKVARSVTLFLSYDTPPRQLAAKIMAELYPRTDHMDGAGQSPTKGCSIEQGDFFVDHLNGWVNICGKGVQLTPEELVLLRYFLSRPRQIITDQEVWTVLYHQTGGDKQERLSLIHDLRSRIEPDPNTPVYLQTVPGIGYWFRDRK